MREFVGRDPRQILGAGQFQCSSNIVTHESTWNCRALNPSGACGLVQAYPGARMASAGADWRTNPATQITWGLSYMNQRYGSPRAAWSYGRATSRTEPHDGSTCGRTDHERCR